MKIQRLVPALIVAILAGHAGAGEPLLDKTDRKNLWDLTGKYFAALRKRDFDPKAYAAVPGLFKDLQKKLDEIAKRRKVDTLLASAVDMRSILAVPVEPVSSVKKNAYYDDSFEFPPGKKSELKYFFRLPKTYSTGEAAPLVLALHPTFSRPDEVKKWAQKALPDALIDEAMVVVPENVDERVEWPTDAGHLRAIPPLGNMMLGYWVDRGKIFVYGEGETASDAIHLATFFPSMFAGVIVRDFAGAPPTDKLINLTHMPVLVLARSADDAQSQAKAFAEEGKKVGVKITVLSADPDENGALSAEAADAVAKFVAETTKVLAPQRVDFVTDDPTSTSAYWLTLDSVEIGKDKKTTIKVSGEINRADNEIKVTTPPLVRSFRVYLNDELVDMGKTIKIIHVVSGQDDAKVLFEGTKARNLDYALSAWFTAAHGNFGEAYTAYEDVSVAQP